MTGRDPVAVYLTHLPQRLRLILIIGGAVLIHLSLGTYHTFGNMLPYMTSFIRNTSDPSITHEKLVWIPTFQGCFPFAMVIGGYLSGRLGPRLAAAIGCFLMSSGVFLSAFTIRHSFWSFLITYGFMFGLGQGIAYVIAVSCVINWAPHMVGLGSGIVAAGFAISSSIFAPIQTALINQENFAASKEGYFTSPKLLDRVPGVFIDLSIVYFIMQLIGLIVICDPPEDFVRKHLSNSALIDMAWLSKRRNRWIGRNSNSSFASYGYSRLPTTRETVDVESPTKSTASTSGLIKKNSYAAARTSDAESSDEDDLSIRSEPTSLKPSEMLGTTTFYWLFAALFCCSFYVNFFFNLYKTFGETFIEDDHFLATAFSLAVVANAAGRIGWGILTDKIGFSVSLSMATSAATLLLLTMPLTTYMGKLAYLIWLILLFTCMAATHPLFITAIVRCFGTKYKTTNYGFLVLSTTLSGIFLTVGCQHLLQSIGYTWAFFLTAAFPAFACFLTVGVRIRGNVII